MTLRERIADWISGGALTWMRLDIELREKNRVMWRDRAFERYRTIGQMSDALEPQPDPRDEVIARLVDALQKIADGNPTIDSPEADAATSRVIACAALAAAKAVQR